MLALNSLNTFSISEYKDKTNGEELVAEMEASCEKVLRAFADLRSHLENLSKLWQEFDMQCLTLEEWLGKKEKGEADVGGPRLNKVETDTWNRRLQTAVDCGNRLAALATANGRTAVNNTITTLQRRFDSLTQVFH
jgi:hypothetical protein